MAGEEVGPRPEPGSKTKDDHNTDSQPVTAAIGEQPAANTWLKSGAGATPRPFLPGTIRQLFRDVKKMLTCKVPAPQPAQRHRREEGMCGGFRLFALTITRRVIRAIFHPDNFMWEEPAELDEAQRIQLWHQNSHPGASQSHETGNFHSEPSNHLSPRL